MKRYIICAPVYSNSNGIRVLYLLAQKLETQGCEAYLYSPYPHHEGYRYVDEITDEMRRRDVVVYPEVIHGNPLQFQNVVRYVLYYPGKNGGTKEYHPSEMIFVHDRKYLSEGQLLTLPWLDEKLFYDDGTPKTLNCYFVHKGGKWKEVPELSEAVEINMHYPENREELAALLRKTKILYSYDDCSAILDEALMCGCDVKVIRENGFEDYKSCYFEAVKDNAVQLNDFITATQNMNYGGSIEKMTKTANFRIFFKIFIYKYIFKNSKKLKKYQDRALGLF